LIARLAKKAMDLNKMRNFASIPAVVAIHSNKSPVVKATRRIVVITIHRGGGPLRMMRVII
jgi:hypothetical protein